MQFCKRFPLEAHRFPLILFIYLFYFYRDLMTILTSFGKNGANIEILKKHNRFVKL